MCVCVCVCVRTHTQVCMCVCVHVWTALQLVAEKEVSDSRYEFRAGRGCTDEIF